MNLTFVVNIPHRLKFRYNFFYSQTDDLICYKSYLSITCMHSLKYCYLKRHFRSTTVLCVAQRSNTGQRTSPYSFNDQSQEVQYM